MNSAQNSNQRIIYVSWKLPTYPSHKPTFSLRAKCWLRRGVGGQFAGNVWWLPNQAARSSWHSPLNANEENLSSSLIWIRFGTCEMRRLNQVILRWYPSDFQRNKATRKYKYRYHPPFLRPSCNNRRKCLLWLAHSRFKNCDPFGQRRWEQQSELAL